jgi:ABC-type Fe3+/spermidine/putrescine transport system ATPase subunit/ABC-type spermidine/putrescine transport system permease subunit II
MKKNKSMLFHAQLLFTLLVCAFLIVPVVQSVVAGLTENFIRGVKSGLTLRWFGHVWGLYRDTIFLSILIALTCLVVTLLLGVPAAYAMVKKQNRWTRLFEELLVTPLAVPGLAIALALIINYGGYTGFRTSWTFILVGHVIFTLPFMVRSVIAIMNSVSLKEFEEGAASLGAGFWQRFFQVVIPNAMPGILAGSLMVFTLSIGEFNLTWMLHTPMTKTLPVGLADSYASMRLEIGSAYTIIFFLMIIPLLIAMQWVAKPRKRKFVMEKSQTATGDLVLRPIAAASSSREEGRRTSGTALRLVNCAKTFVDGTRALEPFNLKVEAGETVVVLGPSGCGKTTLLRIIAGLESPDSEGKVYFGEDDVTDVPIEKRNVGMVFQSYALFPNMTVAENIAYGLKVRGIEVAPRHQRVSEMLEMMKIGELQNRRIDQLSGGQKQRVALARAIAVRPKVLLLDEPLTALDAKLRDRLRVEIDSLLRSLGVTAIYVTHDQSEAMALGDRIVVMNMARVAQVGAPREIYFEPKTRFVAEFIGTINRLKGRLEEDRLAFPGGSIPLPSSSAVRAGENGNVELFFRPEHAALVEFGQGHLHATVVASFFMGDRTRLIIEGSSDDYLTIETKGIQSFKIGQRVEVAIDPGALLTLDP